MELFKKLINKNHWINWIILVISILLFRTMVSDFIASKIAITGIILEFIMLLIIIVVVDLISEEILEI